MLQVESFIQTQQQPSSNLYLNQIVIGICPPTVTIITITPPLSLILLTCHGSGRYINVSMKASIFQRLDVLADAN